jgi:diguanylate cyclase (GGDEF)-like protein/PAS domain S-box-containing protein
MRRGSHNFSPFSSRGRRTLLAIVLTFAISSTLSVAVSIWATSRSKHQAAVIQVAARQRTLAERYVQEVLLLQSGQRADPAKTATILRASALALLDGGPVPSVDGDDDGTTIVGQSDPRVRAELKQQLNLVTDLTEAGAAYLHGETLSNSKLTADERVEVQDPVQRLRILAALTSNVSLNAARSIAARADRQIVDLVRLQVALGVGGLLMSLAFAFAIMTATRRQTAHFRSLVTASTDLVLVFGKDGCRYASRSVTRALEREEPELLGNGFGQFVHPDDQAALVDACLNGRPTELLFRIQDPFGSWRQLEAHVTDLRDDKHVAGVVLNARDVSERVRLEEELTRQAFHDGLTGLPNRALFRDRLDQALARSQRSGDPLAVLLLDLDGFKQVNDSLGHDAGDQLLAEVAQRLAAVIRPSDTVARLGGDEFAILLEDSDESASVSLGERLLERLDDTITVGGHELAVGGSMGIALHPGGAGAGEVLLRDADVAMYAAKEAGNGGYELFQPDMARQFGELLGLKQELRLALDRDEFLLHYQPEIALGTRTIVGVEALLRWNSPTRGLTPPLRFIPLAEASGLIVKLGEFVIREACAQTARWRAAGLLPDPFVTWVNVSGKQIATGQLHTVVQRSLLDAGLPAECLGLEITETALIEEGASRERARFQLEALHELGVLIAIDDFGTGFSSLGQLRDFPLDMIKVDRSFVHGVERSEKDAAITANLVSLAHALGVVAIAEGIESEEQLASMSALGCDLAQGFLFAHPLTASELAVALENPSAAFALDAPEAATARPRSA